MVVGLLSMELYIPESGSLKMKRTVLKSIKDKLRRDFNISIAEVGANDLWRRTLLGISVVSNDRKFANSVLNKIVDRISTNGSVNIITYNIEFL